MVRFVATLIGAAVIFSGLTGAAPTRKRDSSSGEEVGVRAPNGIITSDTAELSSNLGLSTDSSASTTVDPNAVGTVDPNAVGTIDPAAIPTGDVQSGIASDGTIASATSVDIPTETTPPTIVSSPPTIISSGSSGYNMPSYGSGSSSWMGSYNNCVQQCMVTYPPPPTTFSPPSEPPSVISSVAGTGSEGTISSAATGSSTGSGQVYNVIVAPHQGVLRFVPFSVNAQPGDTVRFMWGAGPHTVTQSDPLTPCNASIGGFTSGKQNVSFVFDQVVNSTDPVFLYCNVPGHCAKGMFGAINPTSTPGANTTVEAMMPMWAAANPDIATVLNNTNTLAASVPGALNWGKDIDVGGIDPSFHAAIAKDVLFTRLTMAQNPKFIDSNGHFNPTADISVPADLSAVLDSANMGGTNPPLNAAPAPTDAASSSSATVSQAAASPTNAASSVASSSVAVALVAVLAAFLAL